MNLEGLRRASERRKAEAGATYLELLRKSKSWTPDDEDELLNALQVLGRDVSSVESDAELLAVADQYRDVILQANARRLLDAERNTVSERRRIESQYGEAVRRAAADRDTKLATLSRDSSADAGLLSAARSATSEISKLWGRLSEAFGDCHEWRIKLDS